MNRRTKIFAVAFGACLLYALVSSVAYPRWIEPLLTIDERIAKRQKDLDKLEELEADVHLAKLEYRDLLDRVGSFDALKVKNDLREKLNELIERYKLENANTSPSRAQADSKTRVTTTYITVTAVGTLESVIGFMKDVSALPQLIRIGAASIYPASSSRKHKRKDRVNIRVPIEVKVLPRQKIMEERLTDADLSQPDVVIRHEDRDYSPIWTGEPFTMVIPLKPLVADAGKDKTFEMGRSHSLQGKAKGGDGEYTYNWSDPLHLSDPAKRTPRVNTEEPGEFTFTLTVSDGSGNTAEDTVTITVKDRRRGREPPKVVDTATPADNRWEDRRYLQLRMALLSSTGDKRLDEVMVFDTKQKKTAYYAVGSDFDGGKLVYVHPRGGVVHREDVYFIYPIGSKLDQDIPVDEAGDYPILQGLANLIREAEKRPAGEPAPAADGKQDVVPAVPDDGGGTVPETAPVKQATSGAGDKKPSNASVTLPGPKVPPTPGGVALKDGRAKATQTTPGGKKGNATKKATGADKAGKPAGYGDPGKAKAAKPLPGGAKTSAERTKVGKPSVDRQSGPGTKKDDVLTKIVGEKKVKPGTPASQKQGRKGSPRLRLATEEQ